MNKFNPGEVVQLRSGGALMTVASIEIRGKVTLVNVTWMKSDGELQDAIVNTILLIGIPEDKLDFRVS